MGKYINEIDGVHIGSSFAEKCGSLEHHGATSISEPDEWQDGLICVVDNEIFAAAAYVYNKSEMKAFSNPDGRFKQWYSMEDASRFAQ